MVFRRIGLGGMELIQLGQVRWNQKGAQSPWSLQSFSPYNVGLSWTVSIWYDVPGYFGGGLAALNKALAWTGVLNVIHDSATGNNTRTRWQRIFIAQITALRCCVSIHPPTNDAWPT